MSDYAIEISGLHFAYGAREVLRGIDLQVPAGSIFGFLGRNGAGKTTLIKLLLGLLPSRAGGCRILSLDPSSDPIAVRAAVGYMAEDQKMYGWMTVDQIVSWVGSLYPQWDNDLCDDLLGRMQLQRSAKVKTLSKGENCRLSLLLALGHHPKVVILDDPTLGLDPISRKEFLRDVIGLLQSCGTTVFFSSHLLYEIEPVADHIAILHDGRIICSGPTDGIRERVRRLIFTPSPGARWDQVPGVLDVSRTGRSVSLTVSDYSEQTRAAVASMSQNGIRDQALNLDEIFESYVIGNRGTTEKIPPEADEGMRHGA